MPWGAGNLLDNPEFRRLQLSMQRLEAQLLAEKARANALAISTNAADKRFRIGVRTVTLSILGSTNVDFVWSSPLPSATYKVDVDCSALVGMPAVTITNQTATGCRVSFAAGLLSASVTVVALAIAPATA